MGSRGGEKTPVVRAEHIWKNEEETEEEEEEEEEEVESLRQPERASLPPPHRMQQQCCRRRSHLQLCGEVPCFPNHKQCSFWLDETHTEIFFIFFQKGWHVFLCVCQVYLRNVCMAISCPYSDSPSLPNVVWLQSIPYSSFSFIPLMMLRAFLWCGLLWPAFIPPPLSSVIKMEEGGKMIRVLPIICCTNSLRVFPNKMWESIHCFRTFAETSEGKKSFFGEFASYRLCVQQKKTTKEEEDGVGKTQCESILAEAAEK